MDWHVQLSPNERRQVMQRVAQALKQAQPNYAPQQIAQVARNFEKHLHETATSKEDYFVTCRSRLQSMEQKARLGAMNNANANNANHMGPQMTMTPQQQKLYEQQQQQHQHQQQQQQHQQQHQQQQAANMQAMMAQRQANPGHVQNQNIGMGQNMDARTLLMHQQQSMLQRGPQQGSPMIGSQKTAMSTLNQPMGNIGSPYQQTISSNAMPQALPQNGGRPGGYPGAGVAPPQNSGLSISNPNGVPNAAQLQQIERMCQTVENYRAQIGAPPLEPRDRTPQRVMELYKAMKAHEARVLQERRAVQASQNNLQNQTLPLTHNNGNQAQFPQNSATSQIQRPVPQVPANVNLQQMQQMQATLRAQMQNQARQQAQAQQTQIPSTSTVPSTSAQQQSQQQQQRRPPAQTNTGQGPPAQQLHPDGNNPVNHPLPAQLLAKLNFLPPGVNSWTGIMELGKKKLLSVPQVDLVRQVYSIHQKLLAGQAAAQAQQVQNPIRGQQQQAQNLVANPANQTNRNGPQQQFAPLAQGNAGINYQGSAPPPAYNIYQQQQQHAQQQHVQQQMLQQQQQQQQQQQSQQPTPQQRSQQQLQMLQRQQLQQQQLHLQPQQQKQGPQQASQSTPQPAHSQPASQTIQSTPKRRGEAAGAAHLSQSAHDSPSKRRKDGLPNRAVPATAHIIPTQSDGMTQQPIHQVQQQSQPAEKSQMMQLLLSSCPVEQQARLRQEVLQMEENIANRPRNHVFKNLSEEEKMEVRKQVASMAPYCARVDQLTTIYYMVSKNVQAVQKLLEMKHLFRDHLNWIHQGRYLLDVKDLIKLKINCDKMFASVKEHLTAVARAVQAKARNPTQAASPSPDGIAATFNKGLKPEDLKLPLSRKKSQGVSPPKHNASQQADKVKEENAKIAAHAEALIKKEAEADPIAWAIKQVEAFYIASPSKTAAVKTTKHSSGTPSTILKTPLPFLAANTPNTTAKQLVTASSALPPTPPRSDRMTTRVLGEDSLEESSGLFELFMNDFGEDEVSAEKKPRSGAELLNEIAIDDSVNYWGIQLTPLAAS